MHQLLDKVGLIRFWRKRAQQLRATASRFEEPATKKALMDSADSYDELADRSEAEMLPKEDRSS